MNAEINILVCYYRDKFVQFEGEEFLEIQCGKAQTGIELGMIGDDTGKNISIKNNYWSEITASFWYWQNMDKSHFVGLCSYRRYFNLDSSSKRPVKIIDNLTDSKLIPDNRKRILKILSEFDVIIPIPYTYAHPINVICERNYFKSDFDILENTINQLTPEYLNAYFQVYYNSNKMIGHNMFVMSKLNYNEFCDWVFLILFNVENQIDPSKYSIDKIRVFGYMHEILLSVFIEHKKLSKYNSQISWIVENPKGFKFNNFLYQLLCQIYFFVMYKLLFKPKGKWSI